MLKIDENLENIINYTLSQEDRQKMKEYMKEYNKKKTLLCKLLVCVILYDQLYLAVENAELLNITSNGKILTPKQKYLVDKKTQLSPSY